MRKLAFIAAILLFSSCAEELTGPESNDDGIKVTAGFPETKTTFSENGSTMNVFWEVDDEIGLYTAGFDNFDLRYRAQSAGRTTRFKHVNKELKAENGEEVVAVYPADAVKMLYMMKSFDIITNTNTVHYRENACDNYIIYASGKVENDQLDLQFKHLFSYLRLTIPVELIADRGPAGGLYISSTEPIATYDYGNKTINLETGEIEKDERGSKSLKYFIPEDIGDKTEIVANIAIYPQSEDAVIEISQMNSDQTSTTIGKELISKAAPAGGFKAGRMYSLTLSAAEPDDAFDPDFLKFLLTADNIAYNGSVTGKVDANADGILVDSEISAITGLRMTGSGVESLKGIGMMSNLVYFEYNDGKLTSLDLSKNTKLVYLYCNNNSISDLALPVCKYLGTVELSHNNLSSLDLSGNTGIKRLDCSGNRLQELDLATNPGIYILDCSDNMLSYLDISFIAGFKHESNNLSVGNQKNGKTLTLNVTEQQKEIWDKVWSNMTTNTNVTISVYTQPSIVMPTAIIFSHTDTFDCDGEAGQSIFKCDLGDMIDRTFFSISLDYYIESDTDTGDMTILTLSSRRAIGLNIFKGNLSISINNQDAKYDTSIEVKTGAWEHVEFVYNNGDVLLNDEYLKIGQLTKGGDNELASMNYGRGKKYNFKGKLRNIVVKSGN